MNLQEIVPILRIFDVAKAVDFYIGYLEFQVDWEHRFEPDLPLYMQISKNNLKIHLSEHHGDCSPGAAIRIEVNGIRELQRALIEKQHKYSRPGLESTPWESEECCVTDPFGNRIIFYEYKKK
ncbi:glyoxalase superfamily protein [Paenibacillus harenae]|uniref:Bleomycin resistance protein n=1 Tax=Paenibacillus harenae TaxID=306543 RepID=A0ABT9TYI2_PAEHA|nr:glyoxalase superfamily protein [Paenibacillus harenae]MDQ0112417.1 putative glyoxalase superfamily protein PhnB [Paenibacillus harenae]